MTEIKRCNHSITVVIPTYNTPCNYLRRLLQSLGEQKYKFFEILISDDHSSVDYTMVLMEFIDILDVKYVKSIHNQGMVKNWNYASSLVDTDYFVVMGHDDILSTNYLLRYSLQLDNCPAIVSSSSQDIDKHENKISRFMNVNHRSFILRKNKIYKFDNVEQVSYLILRNGAAFGELSCLMFSTKIFQQANGFSNKFEHAADTEIINRIIKYGDLIYINESLLLRRFHSEQLTHSHLKSGAITRDRHRLYSEYGNRLSFNRRYLCSATIVVKSVYDILRFPSHKRLHVLYEAFKIIISHSGISFFYIPIVVIESLIRKNFDEM